MEIGRAFPNPGNESRKARVGLKRGYRVVDAGQFRLGQGGMNLIVADLVQQHGRPALATAQARDQMVQALRGVWRNRATTKRASGGIFHIERGLLLRWPIRWRETGMGQGLNDG